MDQELIELRNEEAESEDGPITDVALKMADEVLGYRPDIRPTVAPDSDGGICMEWQREQKTMRVIIRGTGLNGYIYMREPGQKSQIYPLQKTKCEESLDWLAKQAVSIF